MRKHFLLFVSCFVLSAQVCAAPALLVADTQSGFVLDAKNADSIRYPASLTKVMTLYITFEALSSGLLSLDDQLPISKHAAAQPRSKLYLKPGQTISVRDAILALIIKSANDVAVVLAEALAPSEEAFALIMTSVAQDLGMQHTVFKNASGLHHPEQHTTARDLAILTMALIDHYPAYYKLFSTQSFVYNNKKYANHNQLLKQYEGAEGLKTGFVAASGYNIITTAKRDNRRLVSIVIGDKSVQQRNKKAVWLLDRGFAKLQKTSDLDVDIKETLPRQKAIIAHPQKEYYQSIMRKSIAQSRMVAAELQKNKEVNLTTLMPKKITEDKSVKVEQGDTESSWSIQVGAFSTQESAEKVANAALALIDGQGKTIRTPQSKKIFRARIYGFSSKEDAEAACQTVQENQMGCLTVAP